MDTNRKSPKQGLIGTEDMRTESCDSLYAIDQTKLTDLTCSLIYGS